MLKVENINKMYRNNWFIFLFTLLSILSFVCLINFLIDPYGHYGTDILKVKQIDPRSYIVNKLKSTIRTSQILLFGSSRCLKLHPKYNSNLSVLNLSLYGGAIEDHYCIIRYAVEDLKIPVKAVILGLEPDLMVSSHPVDKMLNSNKQLSKWLIKQNNLTIKSCFPLPRYIDEISSLLSITMLKNSASLLFQFLQKRFHVRKAFAASNSFDIENMKVNDSYVGQLIGKITESKDSMQARLRQYQTLYTSAANLDEKRIEYLMMFADFAHTHKIKVIFFHPGYSKEFWDNMVSIKKFQELHDQLDMLITRLGTKYRWEIIDYRPYHWKGQPLDFPDGVHPSKGASFIIDNKIQEKINNAF